MTNDLIAQAEALIEKHTTSGYIHRDATLLLPRLVEEIKRLQSDNDFLHKFVDDPGSTLEAALNAVREQSEVIRKQQAAFAATLTKWQQIAIDERAQIIQYHRGILHPLDRPSNFWESMPKDEYAECRDLAAKELDLQVDDTGEELTIAYMLGSKDANNRLKVLQDYVRRLEKEFLDLKMNCCFVAHAGGISEEEIIEYKRKTAQAALDEIREG